MTALLFFLSISIISFSNYYLPSPLFLLPVFSSKYFCPIRQKLILFVSYTLLMSALAFALHINTLASSVFPIFKSILVLLLFPFCLCQSVFFVSKYGSPLGFASIANSFVLPILMILSFALPILDYEASSLGRLLTSYVAIFICIPIAFGYFSVPSGLLKSPLILALLLCAMVTLTETPLTLVALTIASSTLAIIVSFLVKFVPNFLQWAKIRFKISLRAMLIFLVVVSFFVLIFNFLDPRRLRNLDYLITSIQGFSAYDILSLGGGRYLANFSALSISLFNIFDLSGFMLDLPSASIDHYVYDNTLSVSGVASEFIDSRRPNSIFAWVVFNLRIFALPYIIYILWLVVGCIKKAFLERSAINLTAFLFSFFCALYFLFFASPNSFFGPLMILGLLRFGRKCDNCFD